MQQHSSPTIKDAKWGQIRIAGYEKNFRDAKLYPGGAREWDWRETGTHHMPGIQPEDVRELLDYNPSIVILAKGFWQRLQVKQDTQQLLDDKGIEVYILETSEAVDKYNELVPTYPVAGLFHSTC